MVLLCDRPGSCNSQFLSDFTFCTSQALAEALQHNTTLTNLHLYGNQIGDKGSEAGSCNSQFLSDFTFCTSQVPADFSQICCPQALANAMQHNIILTNLDLRGNQIGDKGVEAQVLQFSISFRFDILHIAGIGQCFAAQHHPHHPLPRRSA